MMIASMARRIGEMMELSRKMLLWWEKTISADRYNRMLLFHIEGNLMLACRPIAFGWDPGRRGDVRRDVLEQAWEMKKRAREAKLSFLSRRYILWEIDDFVRKALAGREEE